MIDNSKYKFCNYCKYFEIEDVVTLDGVPPIGAGFCNRINDLRKYRQRFYHNNCDGFSYSIHNHYGFDDPNKIIEFANAELPGFMFRNFELKIEQNRRIIQENKLLMK